VPREPCCRTAVPCCVQPCDGQQAACRFAAGTWRCFPRCCRACTGGLPEGGPAQPRAAAHGFQRARSCNADGAHAVGESAGPRRPWAISKPTAFAQRIIGKPAPAPFSYLTRHGRGGCMVITEYCRFPYRWSRQAVFSGQTRIMLLLQVACGALASVCPNDGQSCSCQPWLLMTHHLLR